MRIISILFIVSCVLLQTCCANNDTKRREALNYYYYYGHGNNGRASGAEVLLIFLFLSGIVVCILIAVLILYCFYKACGPAPLEQRARQVRTIPCDDFRSYPVDIPHSPSAPPTPDQGFRPNFASVGGGGTVILDNNKGINIPEWRSGSVLGP